MATFRNKNRKQVSQQQVAVSSVVPGVSLPPLAGSLNMQTKAGRAASGATSQATNRAIRQAGFNVGPPVGPPTVEQARNQKLVFVGLAGIAVWALLS